MNCDWCFQPVVTPVINKASGQVKDHRVWCSTRCRANRAQLDRQVEAQ